jgi:hypothetical protein
MSYPFQFIYTWELTFGQIIWDKIELVLGTSWGITWELVECFENLMGTHWETKKILLSLSKKKNWAPHEGRLSILIGRMKLLFQKLFVTIFGVG